jgi:hypothetical protein
MRDYLGIPRSTARMLGAESRGHSGFRGSYGAGTAAADSEAARRVENLAALLRVALALLRASGFTLSGERLPDGLAKRRILHAVDSGRERQDDDSAPWRHVLSSVRGRRSRGPSASPWM